MENFEEIAEKCLAGELKGIFKNRKGESIPSEVLCRYSSVTYPYSYYHYNWVCVTTHGEFFKSGKPSDYDIINFIPNMKKEQITIDIPEGMVAIQDETPDGIKIKFVDNRLTYADIVSQLLIREDISKPIYEFWSDKIYENPSKSFYKKVEVLRKLINIRNYFGEDKPTNMWTLTRDSALRVFPMLCRYRETCHIYFDTREHAEQAIKMLGDELKYLFEPW